MGDPRWSLAGTSALQPRPKTNEVKLHSDVSVTVGRDAGDMHETGSKPLSRRMNTDTPEPHHRKPQRMGPQYRKLQLLLRSKLIKEENENDGSGADHPEDEDSDDAPSVKSEAGADRKNAEDIKEFSSTVRSIEPGHYFTKLPSRHQSLQVDKMVSKATEPKEAGGKLFVDAFATTVEEKLSSIYAFGEGFTPIVGLPDDIAIDTPSKGPASYKREDAPVTW